MPQALFRGIYEPKEREMFNRGLQLISCLGLLSLVLISGCADNVISIESEDSVTFTTLETSFSIDKKRNLDVKLRGSRTSGSYSQSVPDGKMILIDDVQIRGPTEVNGDTDLTYASISVGSNNFFADRDEGQQGWRPSVFFGVAQTNMDLTLAHEGNTYKTSDRTTELYMQWGVLYEFLPSFYGGGSWAASVGADLTGISEVDLKLHYALFEHLEIIGGYRWLKYNYYVEDDESIIHIDFRGPFIGLNAPF
jgi:hypothetical protein